MSNIEIATLALGWFWGPDAKFGNLDAVTSTIVGYCGGKKLNPTYNDIGDHSETIQVHYNSDKISYKQLLDIFWGSHEPTYHPHSRQYMSIIFYNGEEQKQMAIESKIAIENNLKSKVYTEIVPVSTFYYAEMYHQKYYLQHDPKVMMEIRDKYDSAKEFVTSTLAARANSYMAGYGNIDEIKMTIKDYNLSEYAAKRLLYR